MKTPLLLPPDAYCWLLALVPAAAAVAAFLLLHRRRRVAAAVAGTLATGAAGALAYGVTLGVSTVTVRHEVFVSADLPPAFDGYRIVHFTDAHLGTFTGWRTDILRRAVDSINAQHADLICFTGDLQNKQPAELAPHLDQLRRLTATDGVCSVLGNHDYGDYAGGDEYQRVEHFGHLCLAQQDLGWYLLANGYHRIRRDTASIVIAGMENDGEGRFPQLGNIPSTLIGLSRRSFVVMLEHDPTSWRRKILPHSHCQLTLSGHTHGGQLRLLGHSPAEWRYPECYGMYHSGRRAINVSSGLGGVVPIRVGCPPEIVVIELRREQKN